MICPFNNVEGRQQTLQTLSVRGGDNDSAGVEKMRTQITTVGIKVKVSRLG